MVHGLHVADEPPSPPPPNRPDDRPAWETWLDTASMLVSMFRDKVHGVGEVERIAAAHKELERAKQRLPILEMQMAELARFCSNPAPAHYDALMRVIAYVARTAAFHLRFAPLEHAAGGTGEHAVLGCALSGSGHVAAAE